MKFNLYKMLLIMKENLFIKGAKLLKNPKAICQISLSYLSPLISDKLFLKLFHRLYLGYSLDLKHPKTYQEKLQWLKLYNRKPEYTIMADKVKAKEWVANKIGKEHIIPTIGVWKDPAEIDFDALPDKFVLKCNHNSGLGMCICKDKKKLDIDKVKRELLKGIRQNYFLHAREWPYKDIPRRIFAEKFMTDGNNADLTDYKFFCFDGEPFMMYVSQDNAENATTDFFDMNFNRLPIRMKDPNSNNPPSKPDKFEEMKNLARILSEGIPHVRVDFYVINDCVYFGEITFFHNAGGTKVYPDEWNYKLGDLIKLPFEEKE